MYANVIFLFSINKCKIGSCAFNFVPFRRSNNQSSEIIDDKRKINPKSLFLRSQRGFRLLVDSFQEPIYNYIRRMVVSHEDAEDVLQEVFIRVFRHLDQFRNEVR